MMKPFILSICLITFFIGKSAQAQEKYGQALNVGIGLGGYGGYYSYVGHSMPVIHLDYEFGVARNFTLAPFIKFYSYSNTYYYRNPGSSYKYYNYRETVIPIGVKGTYYFDELLKATSPWDFYLGASLGLALVHSTWDADYAGDKNIYHNGSPMYVDFHLGAEYHFNQKIGAFLDLSNGVSTVGLSFH